MRISEVKVYPYSELSDKSKEHAFHHHLDRHTEYHWLEEGIDSIKSWCDWFAITISDYSFSNCQCYVHTDADGFDEEELKLMEVTQRLLDDDDEVCEWYIQALREMEPTRPEEYRKSWETGYCADESLLHGWNSHLKTNPNDNIGAFRAAVDYAVYLIQEDIEWQDSQEYFAEMSEANAFEYEEDGTIH